VGRYKGAGNPEGGYVPGVEARCRQLATIPKQQEVDKIKTLSIIIKGENPWQKSKS